MANASNYIHNVTGKVIELHLPYKAVVAFQYRGKEERALLKADKVAVDGAVIPMGESIVEHLQEGSMVKISCHGFDETGIDRCGYFVTIALRQDPTDLGTYGSDNATALLGLYNASGVVAEVSNRQGIITYTDHNGRESSVLFMASKLFLFGKRLNTKQNLQLSLNVEDKIQFDAVPCVETENDSRCPWFATLVWKGKKPYIEYDSPTPITTVPQNITVEVKHLASNPKSVFIHGRGQIMHILNEEYGVALASMKKNRWDSVLFHRSVCFLFKLNLGSHDLTKVFKEGDKIRFIATKAPKHLITQWVASQITVFVMKELEDQL